MAGKIVLSARMKALADMVTIGGRVCDLGCDHGYLSIYLIQHKISPHVLAMDVRKGPLGKAEEHIRRAGLEEYITLRLSDGLSGYSIGEAETLVCAGMGGPLMREILAREPLKTEDFKELILQPQSEIASFRKGLRALGLEIVREDMVLEDGKFYPMMKAVPAEKDFDGLSAEGSLCWETESGKREEKAEGLRQELEDRFGPELLRARHPVLWEFLKREWQKSRELLSVLEKAAGSRRAGQRREEIAREMEYLKEAAKLYGNDYD
ncbi:MAG: class I SAM-dependent methyltransferase [Clostridium sp.]|nr:class I SAM-dependent methyltransferase [Clostridium sp.]